MIIPPCHPATSRLRHSLEFLNHMASPSKATVVFQIDGDHVFQRVLRVEGRKRSAGCRFFFGQILYIYIHIHIHIHIHTHTHTHIHIIHIHFMYVYIYIYIYICVCVVTGIWQRKGSG